MKRGLLGLMMALILSVQIHAEGVLSDRLLLFKKLKDEQFRHVLALLLLEHALFTIDRDVISDEIDPANLCGVIESSDPVPMLQFRDRGQLLSRFNWAERGGVTPIRHQGNCGSCWAFACVAVVESACLINEKQSVDLSEQDLIACNPSGYACNGGNYTSLNMVQQKGLALERDVPYRATSMACANENRYCRIKRWFGVPADTNSIKQAIMKFGPVYTEILVDDCFKYYSGGVFNHEATSGDMHAIVICG